MSIAAALAACSSSQPSATSSIPDDVPEFVTVLRTLLDNPVRSTFEHLEGAIDESHVAAAFYDSQNEYMIVWTRFAMEVPIFEFCNVPAGWDPAPV